MILNLTNKVRIDVTHLFGEHRAYEGIFRSILISKPFIPSQFPGSLPYQ